MTALDRAFEVASQIIISRIGKSRTLGLGSGSSVLHFVRALRNAPIRVIPSSSQIQLAAEAVGLEVVSASHITKIDLAVDGVDLAVPGIGMIKGGGGALLREKIILTAAKRVIILGDESKFRSKLSGPVPIEVHPFARSLVEGKLKRLARTVTLRTDNKGYPYITENGNMILDANFGVISSPRKLEIEVKSIPGVMEVGIFTCNVESFVKAKSNGSAEVIEP
jgi:ribose 5-phosphate isomerase A